MALTTYTELKTAIAARAVRTDLTALIPDFITLTETELNRRLRVRRMIGRATADLADEYSAVPSDFSGVRTFSLTGTPERLRYLTPAQMDLAVEGQASGRPAYYSIVGDEFRFYPTSAATAALTYWRRIPALSDSAPTNWVLTDHPDAYLYGGVLQTALHTRNAEMAAAYGALFLAAVASIEAADRSESDGDLMQTASSGFAP